MARTSSRPSRSASISICLAPDLVSPARRGTTVLHSSRVKHRGSRWVYTQAQHLYLRDIHYLVRGNAAVIIDESTGRANMQSRWMEGIHQASGSRLCHDL